MSSELSRRDFIASSAKVAIACCFLPSVLEASEGKATEEAGSLYIDLAAEENSPLKSPGGGVYIKSGDGKKTFIAWTQPDGSVKVFSSACTHKGVKLDLPKEGVFACPAHGARFDASGKAVRGPAKSTLKEYKCSKEVNTLIVSLKD